MQRIKRRKKREYIMKETNFKAVYNTKTKKFDIIRFGTVYCSLTEQELKQKDFTVKDDKLYDLKG